ncbi:MAG: hypothetical protein AB7F89_15560 [Pirellulaceae bacterium]
MVWPAVRLIRAPFGLGVSSGILVGAGALLGLLIASGLHPWSQLETRLEAVASSGGESMAIASGLIGEGVEGLFVLDFITGQLTCQVVNPRSGQLAYVYQRNVAQDLGVQQGKSPKYLLVTGELRVRQNVSNVKPAESLVYVADVNTGRYVAYMMPFTKQIFDFNSQAVAPMIPVGGGSARNVVVE